MSIETAVTSEDASWKMEKLPSSGKLREIYEVTIIEKVNLITAIENVNLQSDEPASQSSWTFLAWSLLNCQNDKHKVMSAHYGYWNATILSVARNSSIGIGNSDTTSLQERCSTHHFAKRRADPSRFSRETLGQVHLQSSCPSWLVPNVWWNILLRYFENVILLCR